MWATLIPVIAQYGIPFAESLWTKWTSGKDPTAQDWADLKALAGQTAKSQMLAALGRAGIDPASPQGVALLAEVPV